MDKCTGIITILTCRCKIMLKLIPQAPNMINGSLLYLNFRPQAYLKLLYEAYCRCYLSKLQSCQFPQQYLKVHPDVQKSQLATTTVRRTIRFELSESLILIFFVVLVMSQLKHVICPVCEKGILTVVAEVGVEAEGTTVKFQSFSALKVGLQM